MPIVTLGDISNAHLDKFRHAVGVDLHLTDGEGNPRDATNNEARDWLRARANDLVRSVYRREKEAVAVAAIPPDNIDFV